MARPFSSSRILSLITTCFILLGFLILPIYAEAIQEPTTEANNGDSSTQTEWHTKRADPKAAQYLIGVGKADITGPVVELTFMGYASSDQVGTGLRQRIYARAFIVGSASKPADRFIYLNLDTANGDTAVRNGVLDGLKALGSAYSVYGPQNLAVVGTHQHSGPGGWNNYLLPQISTKGFDKQSYQAIVDGSLKAIKIAHESITPGYVGVSNTTVLNANINRSAFAYLANPPAERDKYAYDVDKEMTMIRFQRASDRKNIGILTFFPVHGTSAYANNTHVTGDNKGVAQTLFEKAMADDQNAAPGFVAGFSQANVGDTTPRTEGAWCDDGSGQMCSFETSTCSGKPDACRGRGPLFAKLDLGISDCYENGKHQFQPALDLYKSFDTSAKSLSDPNVGAFHFFQDMRYFNFHLPNGTAVQTCPAALGYSFAAGTSDLPGPFDFTQGDSGKPSANPIWQIVSGVIKTPSAQQKACQEPKPILLDVGELSIPYAWTPNIVDVQLFRLGSLFIIVSPSEVSTMAGRRWKTAVANAAVSEGLVSENPTVVLGSPANTYAHYVVTPEEYGVQRYEGASTLYGKWTLDAYMNLTVGNIKYLSGNSTLPSQGVLPPDNRGNSFNFITGVVMDNPPIGKAFGAVLTQPNTTYAKGSVISATFVGANPRNNLRLDGTYAAIEKLQDGKWVQIRDDSDWFLTYTWTRDNALTGTSKVVLAWETELDSIQSGTYRFQYYGDSKPLIGKITAFQGTSSQFTIT